MPVSTIQTRPFLEAWNAVKQVAPPRSPKPILQGILATFTPGEYGTLTASDLERAIRCRVLGGETDSPWRCVIPAARFSQILAATADDELSLRLDDGRLSVRGLHARFDLSTDDPALFPEFPEIKAAASYTVAVADLVRAIRRTVYAVDLETTRYALGGCLFEPAENALNIVGTDGRRLAKQIIPAEFSGEPKGPSGTTVIPARSLKLLQSIDPESGPITIAADANAASFQCGDRTVWTRLVEGRFPRYQDVFPASHTATAEVCIIELLRGVRQVAICTSDESRGADFAFAPGALQLAATAADVGSSSVEVGVAFDGEPLTVTLDPRYALECLSALADDEQQTVRLELVDAKNPVVMRVGGDYVHVIMPLTK